MLWKQQAIYERRSIYSCTSKRWELAEKSFDKPVVIVTQAEAEATEKGFRQEKTWKFSKKMLEILVLPLQENLF
jgi:hypothetical protein